MQDRIEKLLQKFIATGLWARRSQEKLRANERNEADFSIQKIIEISDKGIENIRLWESLDKEPKCGLEQL